MKVVGYARTSWQEQAQGGYPSVAAQEQAIRAFAARVGLALEAVQCDTGLGPTQGTVSGLVTILDEMEDDWEAVLVTTPCRLDVPTVSFCAREELELNGKKVLVVSEAAARLVEAARAAAPPAPPPRRRDGAEASRRRVIAERLLRGREAGARAGKHQSGPAPYGYRRDYSQRSTHGVLLVPDEEEGQVVQLIFREYLRLRSMKRLIKLLDERGLRTRRGKRWSRAGVSWILKNDTYVGRVHFGEIRAKGRHDSLVPPILFNKVQKLIRLNNKRNRSGEDEEGDDEEALVAVAAVEPEEADAFDLDLDLDPDGSEERLSLSRA
ncbi:MAG: recombinase family protein [Planctomycetes bacterium]|nr:recombinase family protein [Planctomycetota bacterium]